MNRPAADGGDARPGGRAAGEGDLGQRRVVHQRLPGLGAEPGDDIDRPRREAGLDDQLGEPKNRRRGVLATA